MKKNKKICVFIGNRANYSSLKSVMHEINSHPNLILQLVVGGSSILDDYGNVSKVIKKDGFKINKIVFNMVEGGSLSSMAKSAGLGIIEASTFLHDLKPDIVLIVGDRFEVISVAIASAYMNIPIAHTMGGEVSGSIDESIRHAITKFAHIHFPSNKESQERIIKMGEDPKNVFNVGCPRIDLIVNSKKIKRKELNTIFKKYRGVGPKLDLNEKFLVVLQHPVTTEANSARDQIETTLRVLEKLQMQTIMLWPNIDAGSQGVSKGIRTFREKNKPNWLHLFKNLPTEIYINLMHNASCLIGNSSSGIRDSAILGIPVVNIGSRQKNRFKGQNVISVDHDYNQILKAVKKQLNIIKYKKNKIYGDGKSGKRIVSILNKINIKVQKQIYY